MHIQNLVLFFFQISLNWDGKGVFVYHIVDAEDSECNNNKKTVQSQITFN